MEQDIISNNLVPLPKACLKWAAKIKQQGWALVSVSANRKLVRKGNLSPELLGTKWDTSLPTASRKESGQGQ